MRKYSGKHSLAFNGDLNAAEMINPLKRRGESVHTIEFRIKTLKDKGEQGILCSRQRFRGSLCIFLKDDQVAVTVSGNHITSSKSLVSSPTQVFDYRLRPYTGYAVAVVYSELENGMGYAKLYINGHLHGTKFYALGNPAVMHDMVVGGIEGHPNAFFQGFLDDIRVWSEPRTPKQIRAHYNKPMVGIEQGLVAYFPLDRPNKLQRSQGESKWEVRVDDIAFSDEFPYGDASPK